MEKELKKKFNIERIINKSGHRFHSRVVKLLRNEKWNVLVSPYYSDNFTDKPREIDIVAEQPLDVFELSKWIGTVNARLFVECKYISADTVFWFDNKDMISALDRAENDTGIDSKINILQGHHYIDNVSVAKLFTSDKGRGEDNEFISKAINQCLNSLIYYRHRSDLVPNDSHKPMKVLETVSYPLIIVNSFEHFYKTNMSDEKSTTEQIIEPFQLEVNYAYIDKGKNSRNEYFLIDVVSIDTLPQFLTKFIGKDITLVSQKVAVDKINSRSSE